MQHRTHPWDCRLAARLLVELTRDDHHYQLYLSLTLSTTATATATAANAPSTGTAAATTATATRRSSFVESPLSLVSLRDIEALVLDLNY